MATSDLEGRIRTLEDIEAIKKLKYRYGESADELVDSGNFEPFLSCFTGDIFWDGESFGESKGIEELRRVFETITGTLDYCFHFFTQPTIEVNGDEATGHWLILAFYTESTGRDTVLVGEEYDNYRRTEGKWLISEMRLKTSYYGPLSRSWNKVKERLAAG